MDAKGFVIPSGGGSVLSMAPGRSAALKLLGRDTGDSIMLFEETAPAGTETRFHLHRDSDEGLRVERRNNLQDWRRGNGRRAGHLCLLAARRTACVEKHWHRNRPRAVPVYAGRCRRLFRGTAGRPAGSTNGPEANEMRRRHGWKIVGPSPF
jgi:hypothetical protein